MARKHKHYFKDVEHLTEVDVYRVCDIFKVDDHSGATQHALKKLLLPGQRGGGKDRVKDVREAVDTLLRRLEMWEEDALAQASDPEPVQVRKLKDSPMVYMGIDLIQWPEVLWYWERFFPQPKEGYSEHIPLTQAVNYYSKCGAVSNAGQCTESTWWNFVREAYGEAGTDAATRELLNTIGKSLQ